MQIQHTKKTASDAGMQLPLKKFSWSTADILLCLGFAVIIVAVNIYFHNYRIAPSIFADEIGYISTAKYFSGQLFYAMNDATFYHFGYALFLTPCTWITNDPVMLYRLFLCINTIFLLAQFYLLIRVSRDLFQGTRKQALFIAFAISLYYPIFLQTNFVWSVISVSFFYILAVWLVAQAYKKNTIPRYLAAGLSIGFLYAVHPSMLGAVAVGGLSCLIYVILSKKLKSLVLFVGLLFAFGITNLINKLITQELYISESAYGNLGSAELVKFFSRFSNYKALIKSVCGQLLNGFAGSAGLLFIGFFAIILYLLRMLRKKDIFSWQFFAGQFFFLSSVSVYAISILGKTSGTRWDHVFYGRYVDSTTIVFLLIALYFLVKEGWRHKFALFVIIPFLITALTVLLGILEPDVLLREYNAWMNAVPMTLLSSIIPQKNMIWIAAYIMIEYAALMAAVFLIPGTIQFFITNSKKPFRQDGTTAIPDAQIIKIRLACVCFFLIFVNSLSSCYIFDKYIKDVQSSSTMHIESNDDSVYSMIDVVKGQNVTITQSCFSENLINFYAWQYAWNCRFVTVYDDETNINTNFYLSDKINRTTLLWGARSAQINNNTYLYYFPDPPALKAEISGVDSENRMTGEVQINNLSYNLTNAEKFLEIKTGYMWNPYYNDPGSLNLKLTVNDIELDLYQQVDDRYYFSIPANIIEINSITISGKLYSGAEYEISDNESLVGIAIDEIKAVPDVPLTEDLPEISEQRYNLGDRIIFLAENNTSKNYMTTGFYDVGTDFTWTNAHSDMTLLLSEQVMDKEDLLLSVDLEYPYMPLGKSFLETNISINGQQIDTWEVTGGGTYFLEIPAILCQNQVVQITFDMPNATSPALNGDSSDERVFGLAIKSITLNPDK